MSERVATSRSERIASTLAFTSRIKGLRWWMLGLTMTGSILNYLTRSTLATAAVVVLKDLKIDEHQYSYILTAFQVAIMFQPLVGYALDVLGLRIGLAIFATAWSIINMAHGLAHNWQMLAGLRALMGFAEGSGGPAGMKATAEWFPAKERGVAGGVYNIGASFGSMIAPPLVAWAILYHSWQSAFVITGALGLVWVVLWLLFYRPPHEHPALTEAEREYIATGQEAALQSDGTKPSILKLAQQRNFWGIALPRLLADPTWGTLTFWLPLYLQTVRHFDLKQIAMFAWMPLFAADLGCLFGPAVVAALQRSGLNLINARRSAFSLGALMMIGVAFTGLVENPYAAIALVSLAGFAHQTLSVTVITMSSDLFKRSEVATVAGMAGTFGNAGLLTFSLMIGALVKQIGYSPFFICLGVLDVIGALLLWTLVKPPEWSVST
ncbi:MAG TPA: MFS transporter [Pyrinomonadaceae bacterium]|nr:MFS transporter [Pyrinomonadaceae bacterium]